LTSGALSSDIVEQRAKTRTVSPFIWVGLGLTLALLLLALLMAVIKIQTAGRADAPPVLGVIAPFSLTNQNGVVVTEADLRGRVWVADIIFTRCPGPCLRMSQNMGRLQAALPSGSQARLVSLTTDPDFDTPEVLKTYAARFDADPNRWWFLTGSKKEIADVASGSLKLTAIEKAPETQENPDDLFIHSTIFVVVDKNLQLRGIFETEGEGVDPALTRHRILNMVARLEREK
jgi:protein SCO1